MGRTSRRLLKKMMLVFPEIGICADTKLVRVRGINDGSCFKWSSTGVGHDYYFSYESMIKLINSNEIGCWWSSGLGNAPNGWEIYSVDFGETARGE